MELRRFFRKSLEGLAAPETRSDSIWAFSNETGTGGGTLSLAVGVVCCFEIGVTTGSHVVVFDEKNAKGPTREKSEKSTG